MDFSTVDHFATVISGCESINSYTGGRLSGDGQYAFTVLKLNINDLDPYSGQEGMLDKIKAGAKNVKDWIMKLIEAIREWMKGDQVKQVETNTEMVKKAEEFIEKAISQPDTMKSIKASPPAATTKSASKSDTSSHQSNSPAPASKLGYVPSLSKEENSKVMQERYNVILSEIKEQGSESMKRLLELFKFATSMDSENIMKEHFSYIITLSKPLDKLKAIASKMEKDSKVRPTNFVMELNLVIKEMLDIFNQVNRHVENYAKRTDLDPEYDKTYFPFAAKLMQQFGAAINGLIKVHTKMADEFARRTGMRHPTFTK